MTDTKTKNTPYLLPPCGGTDLGSIQLISFRIFWKGTTFNKIFNIYHPCLRMSKCELQANLKKFKRLGIETDVKQN